MYEKKTYETIMADLLKRVPMNIDKREGSVIWDALAPAAAEMAQLYIELDWMLDQYFADTANREYLIRRAAERGLSPKKASHAILKGKFNKEVPIGARFSLEEWNYVVLEELDHMDHTYQLQCEAAGSIGNRKFGTLIPIGYIQGLSYAELTELLIPGEDEEETEAFRERYIQSFSPKAFGGNRADYIEKITAIQGVGGCKVYRTTNKADERVGGHVKCVIISSEYTAASEELAFQVQEKIDPEECAGEGYGLAPIGHQAHVCSAIPVTIHIHTNLLFEQGYVFEDVEPYLEEVLNNYVKELNQTWASKSNLVVRISRIESDFLTVKGVVDIRDTRINGAEENLFLDTDCIVERGQIIGQEIT